MRGGRVAAANRSYVALVPQQFTVATVVPILACVCSLLTPATLNSVFGEKLEVH